MFPPPHDPPSRCGCDRPPNPREESMNGSSSEDTYLDLLRKMVPARTLSLYILLIGVVSGFAKTAADIVKDLGWALLVVAIVCLGINFFARLFGLFGAQKGIKSAALS